MKRNAATTKHRPVILSSGGLFYRPTFKKRSKKGSTSSVLFPKRTVLNPFKRRSRRARRNPGLNLKRTFSMANLTYLGSIGGGMILGFLGIPVLDRFMPQVVKDQRRWAYGVLYILAGSMLATTLKNKALKTASITLAGMGIYDLVQQNLLADLPGIPVSNLMVEKMLPAPAATAPAPVSANYDPGYVALSANYELTGSDDPYREIWQ